MGPPDRGCGYRRICYGLRGNADKALCALPTSGGVKGLSVL
jgi:hypothetical protein